MKAFFLKLILKEKKRIKMITKPILLLNPNLLITILVLILKRVNKLINKKI